MTEQRRGKEIHVLQWEREEERDILEVTDWRVRIRWFLQYTDNTTQNVNSDLNNQPSDRERHQDRRHMDKSSIQEHTPASLQRTNTYLSLSTLLKPGRMCLKLELRSSLGWLLVRFIEPFSRRLRKPWRRETKTVNKTVSLQVCGGRLQGINH